MYGHDRSLCAPAVCFLPMQAIKLSDICSHFVAPHPNSFPLECGPNCSSVEEKKNFAEGKIL
jgi:hypothetical protein